MTTPPPRHPDREFDGYLLLPGGREQLCDCRLWVPRSAREDAYLELWVPASPDVPVHTGPGPLSLRGQVGRATEITASGVWVREGPATVTPRRLAGRSEIVLAHVDRLTERHRFVDVTDRNGSPNKCVLTFGLTDCKYLNPANIVERNYTGDVKVSIAHLFEVSYLGVGRIAFERHYHSGSRLDIEGTIVTSSLVANLIDPSAAFTNEVEPARERVSDVCLLASLAARHRVDVIEMTYANEIELCRTWLNPLSRPRPTAQTEWSDDVLVSAADFVDYFGFASANFCRATASDKQRVREAIYAVAPVFPLGGVEGAFLAQFSALEGLIRFGQPEVAGCATLLDADRWKVAKREVKRAIDSLGREFSKEDKDSMQQKVGELNRPPLRRALQSFLEAKGVVVTDLWPIFGSQEKPGLYEIRNRLAHGNRPADESLGALGVARIHLSLILERCTLSTLGFDVSRSRAIGPHTNADASKITELQALLRRTVFD